MGLLYLSSSCIWNRTIIVEAVVVVAVAESVLLAEDMSSKLNARALEFLHPQETSLLIRNEQSVLLLSRQPSSLHMSLNY